MNKYLSYASYFVSFLLSEIGDLKNIKNVILFGSVVRNEASKDSDIDIYLELINDSSKNKKLADDKAVEITNKFYQTKDYLMFKNRGIDNKINVISGKLSNWSDLKVSIESDGIILYGKYLGESAGKRKIIIYWSKIGKNRGAFLNQVYGFNVNGKRYSGIIEKVNGKKLGKSCAIIPSEHKKLIFDLIKKYKVSAKFSEVYE